LLLAGPKGVGKSWVAQLAEREFAVHYVDADLLILALLEKGASPDPVDGWLAPVQAAVFDALARYPAVSAEITGGWESDYRLAHNVELRGHRVLRVLLSAPLQETLERLRARTTSKVPVSEEEARGIYAQVAGRVLGEHCDAKIDTTGAKQPDRVVEALRGILNRRA
jgi:hypothetical protein